ncbi:MAG TPA: hypothetical protein VLE96_07620 [Chlamydiales bacterium]|nr:hypothetical protein [Chlamydiales bacterium]
MSCTFATTCWENDWRHILLTPGYLQTKMIGNHCFAFEERILVINNVRNLKEVKEAAEKHLREGTLTRYLIADEWVERAFAFFQLKKEDFPNDWVYYNALGPLIAIYVLQTEYLLYHTGDVYLAKPVDWIVSSIRFMRKNPKIQVANLIWNQQIGEVKQESYRKSWNFFYAKEGFSDQQFLVRKSTFQAPIYKEIREDSHHYPRGDVFEKRVFSFLKNRHYERIICRKGSYTHENIR